MNRLSPPLSRNTDPISSHRGADYAIRSGLLGRELRSVYHALMKNSNCTAREISRASGLNYFIVSKRLSVLRRRGFARVGRKRPCRVSKTGIPVQVWCGVK